MEAARDFVERTRSVRSIDNLRQELEVLAISVGFDSYAYLAFGMALRTPSGRSDPISDPIIVSNFPAEWVNRYRHNSYFDKDPVLDICRVRREPLAWCHDDPILGLSPEHSRVMAEAVEFQIRSGITAPIYGPTNEMAYFTVASNDAHFAPTLAVREYGLALHLVGIHTHNLILGSFTPELSSKVNMPGMTNREKECLYWTAQGKTSWEISMIISRSQATVNHHLKNAVAKIGAANKCHAASKAVKYGLL